MLSQTKLFDSDGESGVKVITDKAVFSDGESGALLLGSFGVTGPIVCRDILVLSVTVYVHSVPVRYSNPNTTFCPRACCTPLTCLLLCMLLCMLL